MKKHIGWIIVSLMLFSADLGVFSGKLQGNKSKWKNNLRKNRQ